MPETEKLINLQTSIVIIISLKTKINHIFKMKARCVAHSESPVIGKTYQWIQNKYKGIKIKSLERITLKEINNLKKNVKIRQGDFLVIEGKPKHLFEIGVYSSYGEEESIKDKIEKGINGY